MSTSAKKRPAMDGNAHPPSLKRRKGSTISVASAASAHPLRQTSFPPEESALSFSARSPSVDIDNVSLVSGSQVSGVAAPVKKKRGRKSKAEKAREQTPSVAGGRAATAISGVSGAPKSSAGGGGEQEDDEPDEEVPEAITSSKQWCTAEELAEQKHKQTAFQLCLDKEQFDRFSAWRAAKLPDPVIRRLVNSTVSQSVPQAVVSGVRTATKFFLSELIAIAHKVREEWAVATDEKQADLQYPGKVLSRGEPEVQEYYEWLETQGGGKNWDPDKHDFVLKEEPLGPLRPEHLREAWRRYKVSVGNETPGMLGLWHTQQHSGVERFPVKTGGKRIFK